MIRHIVTASVFAGVVLANLPASAAGTYRFCEGELQERAKALCPGNFDAFVNCTEIQNRANMWCSAHGSSKPAKVTQLPGTVGGGHCGYAIFEVACQ